MSMDWSIPLDIGVLAIGDLVSRAGCYHYYYFLMFFSWNLSREKHGVLTASGERSHVCSGSLGAC